MKSDSNQSEEKSRRLGRKLLLVFCALAWIGCGFYFLYMVIGGGFRSVVRESQSKAIQNNFRQLVSAADQYFLENGATEVRAVDLVGEGKFIRTIDSVAGESYDDLVIQVGKELTVEDQTGTIHRFQN